MISDGTLRLGSEIQSVGVPAAPFWTSSKICDGAFLDYVCCGVAVLRPVVLLRMPE